MRSLTLITTGGTIEKTYDELTGRLENRQSIVGRMLRRLRLEDTKINTVELLSKDSLDMTEDDRKRIVEAVESAIGSHAFSLRDAAAGSKSHPHTCTGVVILHGTDTLCMTGDRLAGAIPIPPVPIVLTGAMRPFEMSRSDALQNLTEAVFAASTLDPGVYVVAHGRSLRFPGVTKDRDRGTFVKAQVSN
jgi:L-asparaginase